MMVISPAHVDDQVVIHANSFGRLIASAGTNDFGTACLELLEHSLDAEHWALYRYRANSSVDCIVTASRVHAAAAKVNVNRFVARCHRVDPSLNAVRQFPDGPCATKIDIGDIGDRQYRRCFELTHVRERLSFFSRPAVDLYQLCVYRGARGRSYSSSELAHFSTLGGLILLTCFHHERLYRELKLPQYFDLEAIELCLERFPVRLSRREREVCSRAAVGKSIESTAQDLNLQKTSVITYRQRAYNKLGISRQYELFALLNSLRLA